MKVKNRNASSAKTKRLIRDTFAALLNEKRNIHRITVTELAARAEIDRSTFYAHYNDIWDVAEDIKAETLRAFFEHKTITGPEDIDLFFDEIYRYIKKNDGLFRLMFQSYEVIGFVQRLGQLCKDRIYQALRDAPRLRDKRLLELEVSTFSDGLAMQFIRYYHGDLSVTLEDIIQSGKLWNQAMLERRSGASKQQLPGQAHHP